MTSINRRIFIGGASAALITPFGFPAIGQSQPIKVGATLPFSGGLELFGEQARIGLELAASEINLSGGIFGRPIEILFRDMRTDPLTAAERARELIQRENVLALIGPITSSARNAIAPIAEAFRTPLLYATNYEGSDDNGGGCSRYLFFFNSVPNQDTAPLIPWMNSNGFGNNYYMFGQNYVWPRNMFRAARKMIDNIGGTIIAEEYTPAGERDFAPIIRKISQSGANILLFALPGADGITFIRQAEEFGLLDEIRIAFLGFSETYLGAFGKNKGENMITGVPFVASDLNPKVVDFVSRVRDQHGPETGVSHYVFSHYNSLIALKKGLERAGEISRESAIDGMEGLSFETATGNATISPSDHHISMNMFIAMTQNGSLQVIKPLGMIEPDSGCNNL